VQAATNALLKLEELRHFIELPALPPAKRAEVVRELQVRFTVLLFTIDHSLVYI
jgi:hypothetical protein